MSRRTVPGTSTKVQVIGVAPKKSDVLGPSSSAGPNVGLRHLGPSCVDKYCSSTTEAVGTSTAITLL